VPLRSEDESMATVEITQRCHTEDLAELSDGIHRGILGKLQMLELAPGFGKPLVGKLDGYRSLTHGRIRILYRFHPPSDTAFVVMVGLRTDAELDDVYAKAKRLLRAGRLDDAVQQLRAASENVIWSTLRGSRERYQSSACGR